MEKELTQKIVTKYCPAVYQAIYQIRLIDIDVAVLDYVAECLYSYWIFHNSTNCR